MSEPMTADRVRELLVFATPGPWDSDGDSIGHADEWVAHLPIHGNPPDADLIAAAPEIAAWALSLAAALERVRELHSPPPRDGRYDDYPDAPLVCLMCGEYAPCPTLSAIDDGGAIR